MVRGCASGGTTALRIRRRGPRPIGATFASTAPGHDQPGTGVQQKLRSDAPLMNEPAHTTTNREEGMNANPTRRRFFTTCQCCAPSRWPSSPARRRFLAGGTRPGGGRGGSQNAVGKAVPGGGACARYPFSSSNMMSGQQPLSSLALSVASENCVPATGTTLRATAATATVLARAPTARALAAVEDRARPRAGRAATGRLS
jgi:hypothetical protein